MSNLISNYHFYLLRKLYFVRETLDLTSANQTRRHVWTKRVRSPHRETFAHFLEDAELSAGERETALADVVHHSYAENLPAEAGLLIHCALADERGWSVYADWLDDNGHNDVANRLRPHLSPNERQ